MNESKQLKKKSPTETTAQADDRCRLLVIGTDTDVGKTHVTATIVRGLRQLGRSVWLHKSVACGDWDGSSSADGRALRALAGDGQDPASVCPQEFSEDCSPHIAAQRNGVSWTLNDMLPLAQALDADSHDFIVEGAGGLLAPLGSDDCDIRDLATALKLPTLLVTRPHLGTLSHTRLTVEVARHSGLQLIGMVVNHHQPNLGGIAVDYASAELARLCQLPVLAELPYAPSSSRGREGLASDLALGILRAT